MDILINPERRLVYIEAAIVFLTFSAELATICNSMAIEAYEYM
jgi:hypothetical protein